MSVCRGGCGSPRARRRRTTRSSTRWRRCARTAPSCSFRKGTDAMSRTGRVERVTKESSVLVEVDLDGSGKLDIATGIGFYDHMLSQLGKHGLFDLTVKTEGDLHIDSHHTVEDTAIALGTAFRAALGDKAGIRRFAN